MKRLKSALVMVGLIWLSLQMMACATAKPVAIDQPKQEELTVEQKEAIKRTIENLPTPESLEEKKAVEPLSAVPPPIEEKKESVMPVALVSNKVATLAKLPVKKATKVKTKVAPVAVKVVVKKSSTANPLVLAKALEAFVPALIKKAEEKISRQSTTAPIEVKVVRDEQAIKALELQLIEKDQALAKTEVQLKRAKIAVGTLMPTVRPKTKPAQWLGWLSVVGGVFAVIGFFFFCVGFARPFVDYLLNEYYPKDGARLPNKTIFRKRMWLRCTAFIWFPLFAINDFLLLVWRRWSLIEENERLRKGIFEATKSPSDSVMNSILNEVMRPFILSKEVIKIMGIICDEPSLTVLLLRATEGDGKISSNLVRIPDMPDSISIINLKNYLLLLENRVLRDCLIAFLLSSGQLINRTVRQEGRVASVAISAISPTDIRDGTTGP